MKFATCISGAACCVRNFSAMIADQNAITVASPIARMNVMIRPSMPGQWTPRHSATVRTNVAGIRARIAALGIWLSVVALRGRLRDA